MSEFGRGYDCGARGIQQAVATAEHLERIRIMNLLKAHRQYVELTCSPAFASGWKDAIDFIEDADAKARNLPSDY